MITKKPNMSKRKKNQVRYLLFITQKVPSIFYYNDFAHK